MAIIVSKSCSDHTVASVVVSIQENIVDHVEHIRSRRKDRFAIESQIEKQDENTDVLENLMTWKN